MIQDLRHQTQNREILLIYVKRQLIQNLGDQIQDLKAYLQNKKLYIQVTRRELHQLKAEVRLKCTQS